MLVWVRPSGRRLLSQAQTQQSRRQHQREDECDRESLSAHTDLIGPAMALEMAMRPSTLTPQTGAILRRLGDLEATTLAVMHGSSFTGDTRRAFYDLAGELEALAAREAPTPAGVVTS